MQRAFVPGAVDYDGAMSRDFNAGRALSPESMAVWRSTFEPYVTGAERVLDVGSGTGRFTVLLGEWFDVAVIGVEPARGMRKVAAASAKGNWLQGRFAECPYNGQHCSGVVGRLLGGGTFASLRFSHQITVG